MKKIILIFVLICFNEIVYSQCSITGGTILGPQVQDSIIIHIPDTTDTTAMNAFSVIDQTRHIYWIHGLGGNEYTWHRASGATLNGTSQFPARLVTNHEFQYDETNDLNTAINSVYDNIHSSRTGVSNTERANDYIIAYSQGGLISRLIDKQINTTNPNSFNRDFGGIVTFGSPHKGAKIVDNIINTSKLAELAYHSCTELRVGPCLEKNNKFLLRLFDLNYILLAAELEMCTGYGIFAGIYSSLASGSIASEYQTTSSAISYINNYSSPTPAVAFYGIENQNAIAYRTMTSFAIDDGGIGKNLFMAQTTDEKALEDFQIQINKYNNKAAEYNKQCSFLGIRYNCKKYKDVYNGYIRGVNYLANLDNRWEDIIGARTFNQYAVQKHYCDCGYDRNNPNSSESLYLKFKYGVPQISEDYTSETPTNPCDPGCTVHYYVVWVNKVWNKESDGVVLAESASGIGGTLTRRVPMNGSNHNQLRNDNNTKQCLRDLYNGFYGKYFLTSEQ